MAIQEFRLPDIGEGIAEGEIVAWKVQEGQSVKEEDEFVEVMTDKATVTITAPFDAVVKELKAAEGDIVPVESVIAVFDVGAAAPASNAASSDSTPAPEPAPVPVPAAAATAPAPAPAPAAAPAAFEQASPGKVLAAPATRRRARELGIDLHGVNGTGPSGRVTNEDVANFAAQGGGLAVAAPPAPAPAHTPAPAIAIPPAPTGATETRTPFRGLRRKIADAMSRSKNTAAHFTYVDDINVTKLVDLRKQAKEMYAPTGVNVTFLPFIMKAIVAAMRQYPEMNSALDETTNEHVIKHYYNFGIATDTDQGLIVPVVKNVESKSIVQLARDIQDLAERTRNGQVSVDELQGGTFTITNAGNIGGLFATPVINMPEVAICGVHAIKKTPVINDEGEVVPGRVMYLSVSIDHRIVDGATGARWMNVIKECLEEPSKLLFEV